MEYVSSQSPRIPCNLCRRIVMLQRSPLYFDTGQVTRLLLFFFMWRGDEGRGRDSNALHAPESTIKVVSVNHFLAVVCTNDEEILSINSAAQNRMEPLTWRNLNICNFLNIWRSLISLLFFYFISLLIFFTLPHISEVSPCLNFPRSFSRVGRHYHCFKLWVR